MMRAHGRGRALALAAAWMLLTGVAPALTTSPAMAEETPAVALTESEQALQDAVGAGERVEVVGERTERETVFANPDGATFTLEKSIAPVRVDAGSGWVQPDATLVRREDGSIGPKAAVVDVSFSVGGSGAGLVTIGQDGQSVSMGWPGELPEPRLDGERAIYENVLPDVNLILTATVEGFRQVLEVETPEAAVLPELRAIEYGLTADGLRLREGAVGSVEALDGNGQVVFRSPTAQMWNSAGDDGVVAPEAGVGTQSAGFRTLAGVSAEGTSTQADPVLVGPSQEGDPLAGPGAGDEAAVMDVQLAEDSLTVVPDRNLIAATEAEDFPLYIDPSVEMNESEKTVLSSDGDVFYDFAGGENGMSVGKCGTAVIGGVSYYCGSGYVNRMYFEFVPTKLMGKHVLDATFRVTETWSFSCSARWVSLKRTDAISQSSKWPGPAVRDHMGDRYVSAGRGTACSPSQPRAVIEFNDNPEEADENLTATTRAFADGKTSVLTLRLSAQDETDTEAWKRFDDDAVLVATYMSKPATPAEYGFPSGSTQICSKSESAPTTISDTTPILVATPRVVSGGESAAMLRVYYDVDGRNADGTWSDAPQPTTGSLTPTTGHVAYSNTLRDFPNQSKDWNVALKEGTLYRFTVNTQSFPNTSYTAPLVSGGTPWCYFKVDPTAPKPPVVKFNSVYAECVTGGPCEVRGQPGQADSVTFSSAAGDSNTHYEFKLSTDTAWSGWKAATAGSYTTTITPPVSGTFVLNVRAKDSLGRAGEKAVKFLVGEWGKPIGYWDFNEASGVAVDRSAATTALQNNMTLTASGAIRTDHGRRGVLTAADDSKSQDKALSLTKSSLGGAGTSKQVVETQASYTVTAWGRLDSGSSVATVLAQDGSVHSSFYLSYCYDVQTWCVRLPDTDTAGSAFSGQRVNALNLPQFKAWTHLGVVVNRGATTNKLAFYVNGVLQGTDNLTADAWASSGGLQVGRAKYNGSYTDYFPGEIDEVVVRQDALTSEGMAELARAKDKDGKGYVELVAQYNPSGSGTSLQDSSGYGNTLTMGSGASLDGENIVLDGVDDFASTVRPLVDDTGSFTVSTAVDVDTEKIQSMANGSRMQVLGQQTGTGSSWGIWFEKTGTKDVPARDSLGKPILDAGGVPITEPFPEGRWHFGQWKSDGTGVSAQSKELLTPKGEIRLTGVLDAPGQTASLYAGTSEEGVLLAYKSADLGSGFTVGKGWTGSAWSRYLPGKISDIRLWAGALSDAQQVEAVVGP
ncbi:LamG-like jellyroll fold domain-containing protein [Streptomyces sp. NBC_00094]|uniref:LamG-like jellyroll fold domain-containing protein n=1 Tax=Streptomyces sp. NBC_00094 TaxID=2903620 RepID=UPI002253AD20|nr:LamG-like jellyroll fold domain-containing protein [Streptomyces sp. NBC_00094]MCX5389804.1 LamG domain-containing protein [Streptomyces sp. NBC_00094]